MEFLSCRKEHEMQTTLDIKNFFPDDFTIKEIKVSSQTLTVELESNSHHATCPTCQLTTYEIHGKRQRKNIIDLPILEHSVLLNISLKEYVCPNCQQIFAENPDNFLQERKSITTRCENYLSNIKHILCGHTAQTKMVVNNAHIPVQSGVVRYIPVSIDIYESDKNWIYKTACQTDNDSSDAQYTLDSLLEKIHTTCEQNLHPNLVDLSRYDLSLLVESDKRLKERVK